MNTNGIPPVIAVLGLGPMGAAIARASAAAGHSVVAWNRTRRTAQELGLPGDVEVADTPGEAVAAAGIVVVCVRDHAASGALLAEIAPAAGDRVVLNVSSGTPEDTVASARDAARRGIRYVTGAVMVPTPLVGTADCAVLYAGASEDLDALAPVMAALGGTSDVLGDDHAVPAALDLAMLDLYFVGIYTHLHATALAASFGIDPGRFLPYARSAVATVRRVARRPHRRRRAATLRRRPGTTGHVSRVPRTHRPDQPRGGDRPRRGRPGEGCVRACDGSLAGRNRLGCRGGGSARDLRVDRERGLSTRGDATVDAVR